MQKIRFAFKRAHTQKCVYLISNRSNNFFFLIARKMCSCARIHTTLQRRMHMVIAEWIKIIRLFLWGIQLRQLHDDVAHSLMICSPLTTKSLVLIRLKLNLSYYIYNIELCMHRRARLPQNQLNLISHCLSNAMGVAKSMEANCLSQSM